RTGLYLFICYEVNMLLYATNQRRRKLYPPPPTLHPHLEKAVVFVDDLN
ncbi:unnamed protein product, partial [Ectocarpus sp. 13 AM-2016]